MSTQNPSGKFVLRVPPPLHERLRTLAQKRGISLNEICLEALHRRTSAISTPAKAAVDFFDQDLIAVYQFGSTVRGQQTKKSDIDLLIVLKDKIKIDRSLYRRWDEGLHQLTNEHSVHFVHLPKSADQGGTLWFEIAMEGVQLYDPEWQTHAFLIEVRKFLLAKSVQRTYSHGQTVWVGSKETENAK